MNRVTLAAALSLCAAAPLAAQNQTKAMRVQKGPSTSKTVWPDEGPKTWAPRPTSTDISAI